MYAIEGLLNHLRFTENASKDGELHAKVQNLFNLPPSPPHYTPYLVLAWPMAMAVCRRRLGVWRKKIWGSPPSPTFAPPAREQCVHLRRLAFGAHFVIRPSGAGAADPQRDPSRIGCVLLPWSLFPRGFDIWLREVHACIFASSTHVFQPVSNVWFFLVINGRIDSLYQVRLLSALRSGEYARFKQIPLCEENPIRGPPALRRVILTPLLV